MVEKSSRGDCVISFGAIELHENFGGCTGETVLGAACVDIMATSKKIGSKAGIVQQSLQNRSLVTGLTHIPYTTSTTVNTWVLVSIILYIDLRSRILGPDGSTICQASVNPYDLNNGLT